MSRIIHSETAGKERNRAVKVLVLCVRELLKQQTADELSKDLIACILIQLDVIHRTVDLSVEAWEERGYWVKADHFRMEWRWSQIVGDRIRPLVYEENYPELIPVLVELLQSLNTVKVSENHRMGTPWVGCWQALQVLRERNGDGPHG